MSVTFFIPQAPVERIQPYPDTSPEFWDVVPVAPFSELNLSNSNAAAILQAVAPWADSCCGTWEGETLHRVRKSIARVLNQTPEILVVEGRVEYNYVMQGRDLAYVYDRLTRLMEIIVTATKHGFYVCYG